ncbi:hypothetical protein LJR225_001738 [Phenylobacterium sp. LjRoot225]|uniref:DUF2946 family protein n=1 Tax=Phenylobacterium sp. LjRoot225 TaxID=3342285 RepID=UPI003ED0D43D
MGTGSRLAELISRGAYALAVIALAMRVLVPGGFMVAPQTVQGGLPTLVICTGQGAMTVAVDTDGQVRKLGKKAPAKPADKSQGRHPCAFAGVAAPLTAPIAHAVTGPAFATVGDTAAAFAYQRPGLGLPAPPPPTTGPPILV